MPGVFWFLIYYVFLVRVMVNTEKHVNALLVVLIVKGNGKTYIVLLEQTPDLVSNTMDVIRAQKMEF